MEVSPCADGRRDGRRTLGGIHGIPRVHYKGRQGDYYIMVRCSSACSLCWHMEMPPENSSDSF